ncbi:MAG: type transport system ATP-binding protein [Eubacteriales bacterium]|nr:type transport system ATP-binding protein [Eubacteriales bacterium]
MTEEKTPAIEVTDVSKSLGPTLILKNVNLTVAYGEIVGIIGPNASGKTLLLRLLCGLAYPDEGRIITGGKLIGPQGGGTLAEVGILIETPGFLPHLSGMDNLRLLAMLRGKIGDTEIAAAMQRVGLNPTDRRPVKAYSMGMRQRLGIAQAIMERPRILLLDEPTNALDPEYSNDFLAMLRELRDQGVAIVLTSHELEEVKAVADRVLTLKNGILN